MHARPRIVVTTQPRGQQRLNKRLIIFGGGGLLVLALLAYVVWNAQRTRAPKTKGPRERPVAEYVVTEKPKPMRPDLTLPRDYLGKPIEDARPQAPTPATPGQPAKPSPVPQGRFVQPQRPAQPTGLTLPPPPPSPGAPPPTTRVTVVPARATGSTDPKTARWFGKPTAVQGNLLTAPLPADPAEAQASKLFPKAAWEMPKDPTKVLYANQVINGQLSQNINSDFPGTVRIKITQDVVDRWGQGTVLLPIDTDLMATMEGQAKYGQKRIPLAVYMALPPDGSAITFVKSQAGDAMGAAGVPANVNNHYGSLILGAGIQAFMNIGTRAVAGSTTGFNPTLEQEFAQDIARSANRTANRIIERELQRNPTLEQDFGFPVTIQFTENISFQSSPTVVSK